MSCGEYCSTHGCHGGIGCAAHRTHYKPEPQSSWPVRFGDLVMVVIMVLAILYLLGVFGPGLDRSLDEYHQATSLTDAQHQAQRDFRRDLAAAKLCREEHGEAGFTWTDGGQLVCIPRHGKSVVASNP